MDGSPESGRRYMFRMLRCYRLLRLSKNATANEMQKSYLIKKQTASDEELDDLKFAYESSLEFLNLFKTLSKEAKDDWAAFFEGYRIFLYSKSESEKETFEQLDEGMQLSFFDSDMLFQPLKYSGLRKNSILWGDIFSFLGFLLFILIGIPVLILMWNIHPVLGLLGIVLFVWLVKKRLENGYFFE